MWHQNLHFWQETNLVMEYGLLVLSDSLSQKLFSSVSISEVGLWFLCSFSVLLRAMLALSDEWSSDDFLSVSWNSVRSIGTRIFSLSLFYFTSL